MLQNYARLCVVVDKELLTEQCAVTVEDALNKRCRVTVRSAVPEKGPELDARLRLGRTTTVAVHLMGRDRRVVYPPMLEVVGPIVASRIEQRAPGAEVEHTFTVEQGILAAEEA